MGGSKTKTQSTNTNTFSHINKPVTQEVTEVKDASKSMKGTLTSMVKGQFAGQRQRFDESFLNPMGAHTTPAIRDATKRAGHEDLHQQEMMSLMGADAAENDADFARKLQIAGLTAPQFVQTGGTSSGMQQQSGGIGQAIVGGGAQVGSAALM